MGVTYHFGYPNMQRIVAIDEAVNNAQNGEKYQVNYRGKYRPLTVIEVPIEMLVYRIENIRTKSLQKEWLAQHRDLPRDLFVSDPNSIEAQENQHQVLKLLVDKENLLKTFKDNDKLQQTEPLICSKDGVVVNGNRRLCAWRELYYGNKSKYAHFQTVRVAVLPDSDPQGIYDLEVALQIHSDMKAEYVWHAIAADYQEKFDAGMDIGILAAKQNKKPEEIRTYIECYNYAAQYLESIGHPDEWTRVDKQEYAFKQIVIGRKNIVNPGDKELFYLLFSKKYNSGFLGDLLKIKAFYKLWANHIKKTDDGTDPYKVGLVNNGMFFMTAIIGVVCKIYYRQNVISQITSSVMSEQKLEVVAQHDIDHPIFRPDLDKKEPFFTLFEYCYTKFYRPGYEFLKTFKEKYNNYSNFTKINNNYTTYVFKQIEFEYRHGIPAADLDLLRSILYEASDEDILRNEALLEKYVNVVYVDAASESNIPENVSEEIKEALISYRTKTYKLNRIKAYEVFKNVSCDRIAKFAPTSLEDLKALRCLDEAQITLYGQDIIEIVKQVLNK